MRSPDRDDLASNASANPHFNRIAAALYSRRQVLKAGAALGTVGFLGGGLGGLAGCSSSDPVSLLGFESVAASSGDDIVLPPGYRHAVLCRWGDPLFADSPAWKGDASEDAAAQALQFGDNNDGMHFFPLGGNSSSEGLLVMNHEYINPEYFFTPSIQSGETPWALDHVRKSQHAHGVTVAHLRREAGEWKVVVGSGYNRRIHANSPMQITGPARGHAQMRTPDSPTGEVSLGTINNCGNGFTPWGTYLTCEENFNGYFGTTSGTDTRNPLMQRYGISPLGSEYRWEEHDARFDYAEQPNESNRFGWIVEIDPFRPTSIPAKRTALGRFKHENAALTLAADRRVVVYLGDDQVDEYLYKFVSAEAYDPAAGDAANKDRNLLENGRLYVAKFDAGAVSGDMMGGGEWIPLELDTPTVAGGRLGDLYADQGALLIATRQAADAVGATKMDRPEWVAVHPRSGEVYCTLTNNSGRSVTDEANPRANNLYGQILRWREAGRDAAATRFEWDLFVLAGNPVVHPAGDLKAGSANVNADNLFNSPDGLAFDADGRLWIQTDGKYSNSGEYAGMGNNQMLVADPASGEIRRFLVGPSACEITGISFTPDQRTLFINVQHPGEYGGHPNTPEVTPAEDPLAFSRWPDDGAGGRPRPATVAVWKADGGKVGS